MRLLRPDASSGRPALVGLVAAATLLAGCVQPDDPSVKITKVEADLVFGVKGPPADVIPPNAGADELLGNLPPIRLEDLPGFGKGGSGLNRSDVVLECPKALPSDSAKDAAEVNVTGLPVEGLYKWQRGGEQKRTDAPPNTPGQKVTGFEKRIVRNIKVQSPTVHTFETVQVDITGQKAYVSTWRARQDALNRQTTGNGVPLSGPHAGEPDRGVSLIRLETLDNKGQSIGLFEPVTGVLFLPLPVSAGETYRTAGVDPKTGQTMAMDVHVLNRERVDACGALVDGWAVEATQTTTTRETEQVQVQYRYIISPQYGGLMVSERLQYTAGNIINDFIFTLGQLKPDPLPAAPA